MFNPFKPKPIEESHITLGGGVVELAFNETTRTVVMIDQSGSADLQALTDLEKHFKSKGWFLHVMAVMPSTVAHSETEYEHQ